MTDKLKEDKARLFQFLDSMPVGVYVMDAQGKPFYTNAAASKVLGNVEDPAAKGLSLEELAKLYVPFVAGTDTLYPQEKQPIVLALSGKTSRVTDMEMRVAGEKYILDVTAVPIKDINGKVIFAVSTFVDISDAKAVERSRDEFFSIASHELRTPLTAIRGNTSLIVEYYANELKNKDLKEMINDIHASSVRLIEIVNDFLDTSRLEMGKVVFKRETVDITGLVQDVIKEVQSSGTLKDLSLVYIPSKDVIPNILADKDKAREIIINLIGNATKYTKKGGITVGVEIADENVEVLIKDTGVGISKENQKLLFKKFQQATDNIYTRDSSQSTGLGLYISKMMAEAMGGKIELKNSGVGVGSTFVLSLPISKQEGSEKA